MLIIHPSVPRHKISLGKFEVIDVTNTKDGRRITINIQNKLVPTFLVPHSSDVKPGDLLTLYTEVLAIPPKGLN